jgi:alpha-galactosidase/6-phospho-beta-glucosidase family protein
MRKKKRTVMIASFALGAFLFAGTALADIMDKSGYDQLKDAVKMTATNCTENYQSFTLDISMVLKDNGQVIFSDESVNKYDAVNGAQEQITTTENAINRNRNHSYYRYSDQNQMITKSSGDNNYIVTTYREKKEGPLFSKEGNPFNQEEAKDIERILDALVMNLKDHVVVTENPDGSKSLSGNLSEGQIPALINALASFQMKQQFNGNRQGITDLASDVYVKEAWGTAKINEDGSLENILLTMRLWRG